LVSTSKKYFLNRLKMLAFLEKLAGTKDEKYHTLYLSPRIPVGELDNLLEPLSFSEDRLTKLEKIINSSGTGSVIFRGNQQKYLIVPPFPVTENGITDSLKIESLKSLLSREYIIGILLVRLGSYAIGICRGDKLIGSKVGTGLVHGRHRQGGSSSHRFERHRDKQIESFLIRVCGHVREQLEPYVKSMDYMVYGGARTTILLAQKYCPMLQKLDKPVLLTLLDIPEPRQAVLETAVNRVWSSEVYEWQDD
jgi:hypothetical protein